MSQYNKIGKKLYFVVNGEQVIALLTREEARESKTSQDIVVECYLTTKQREKLQEQIDRLDAEVI